MSVPRVLRRFAASRLSRLLVVIPFMFALVCPASSLRDVYGKEAGAASTTGAAATGAASGAAASPGRATTAPDATTLARGAYVAKAADCAGCHTATRGGAP
jgi:mono/diheme cytochrome c family protein